VYCNYAWWVSVLHDRRQQFMLCMTDSRLEAAVDTASRGGRPIGHRERGGLLVGGIHMGHGMCLCNEVQVGLVGKMGLQ
jgi:hypothetical protein